MNRLGGRRILRWNCIQAGSERKADGVAQFSGPNDAILCGGIDSNQWCVTVMKDQQTALQPTHSFVATLTLRTRALRTLRSW